MTGSRVRVEADARKWSDLSATERLARMLPLIERGVLPYAEAEALWAARDAERAAAERAS